MRDTDPVTKTLNKEQELSNILALLDPPLDRLAYRASHFLCTFPEPSIERMLAAYFELFALGYTLWDRTYYYHSIHEYFYGAYLRAKQIAGDLPSPETQELLEMLEKLTKAMIAFTWYENALARNDPKGVFVTTDEAVKSIEKALEKLDLSSLAPRLKDPIKKYLKTNLSVLRGLHCYAVIFLDTLKKKEIPLAQQSKINQLLSEITSQELLTYLRVQYSYVQRFAQAHAQRDSDLCVNKGQLLLRTIGYVGKNLITELFNRFASSSEKEIRDAARKETNLPLVSVRSSYMHDIFETGLGKEYLQQIIFELSTEKNSALTFFASDGENEASYSVKTFQVCLTRLGSISVEFGISIENVSVSHTRILQSLIGPDTVQFDFVWHGAPPDAKPGVTNLVDYFLKSQEWVERIQNEMPAVGSSKVDEMEDILEDWAEALMKLALSLPRSSVEVPNKNAEQSEERKSVQDCFRQMYDLARKWLDNASELGYSESEVFKLGDSIFPKGVRFRRLMDIAEEVLKRIKRYLKSNLPKENHESSGAKENHLSNDLALKNLDEDIRDLFYFDANTGWAVILACNKLTIVGRDGWISEPNTERDHQRLSAHPEFKGFIIPYRAARVSLDDWLFVTAPSYRNLATIRSHENDIMCIGENRAFLYVPDEPEWVVKQDIETVRFINDIRTLLFTFNIKTRHDLNDLKPEIVKSRLPQQDKISGKKLKKVRLDLSNKRNDIEDLRGHAEDILDILRSCTISKYQDHSDLLKEMIKESKVNDYRDSLEHKIEHLGQLHLYLNNQLQQRFDESVQNSQRHISQWLNIITVISGISALISAIAVMPTINTWLDDMMGKGEMNQVLKILLPSIQQNLLVVLFVVILLGFIVTYLIVWLRNRNT